MPFFLDSDLFGRVMGSSMKWVALAIVPIWICAPGCDYVFQEGDFPTLSGEYTLKRERSVFEGYQRLAGDGSGEASTGRVSSHFMASPQSYPFAVQLPERIEVWMEPLNQRLTAGYQYRVHLLVDLPGMKGVLLDAQLNRDGKSVSTVVPTDTFDDSSSPVASDGRGYACRWEVGASLELQFNRPVSEFEKVYPPCEVVSNTNRDQSICVSPAPGYESTLPLHFEKLDTTTPLEFTLSLRSFRNLRSDSSSWLCAQNPNYSVFETGNRVLGTYQLEVPNWELGDPRIQDNADIIVPMRKRIAEVRDGNRGSLIRNIYQLPADGLSLNLLYPPVEWTAP